MGQWKDGKKEGEGELLFPTGCFMHGFFTNDQSNGYGELRKYLRTY